MNKQILFWTGILTAISVWLSWSLRSANGPVGEMARFFPSLNLVVFAAGFWIIASGKHRNSARGFWVGMLGPPLCAIIILGTARFSPTNFDLSIVIALHLFLIGTGNYVTTSTTWITGFPTYWNVKNPTLWGQSQRFFGPGMVALGFISLVVSLYEERVNEPVLIGGFIFLIALGNAHSWWIRKRSQAQFPSST